MNKIYIKNQEGSDYVIGDLHGCYDEFLDMLDLINFDFNKDRIFSVGDLIDRGKDSLNCLRLISKPWFNSVLGNHEDMIKRHLFNYENNNLWYLNGGQWYEKLTTIEIAEVKRILSTIQLPLSITVETDKGLIGICHAQPPSDNWDDVENVSGRDRENMIWGRSWLKYLNIREVYNVYKTYHGHTPVKTPVEIGNVNFIDTGVFFEGILTCVKIN